MSRPSPTHRVRVCVIAAIALSVFIPAAVRADEPRQTFDDANALFEKAEQLLADDPDGARELFAQAAALYGELVDQQGIDNPDLHANRGTALLLSGDVGRAVASYLRGDRLAPGDEAVRAGLAAARRRVQTQVGTDAPRRVEDIVLFWRGHVARGVIAGVGLGAWWACCMLAALALRPGVRRRIPTMIAALLVAAYCAGSLAVENAVYVSGERGVIVADADARLGPGVNAYAEAFSAPLSPGVEGEILEHRGEWVRIRLHDGRSAWVPADTIVRV